MIKINSKAKSMEEVDVKVACGFQMSFENGNTISIQFGLGAYGSNRDESKTETNLAEIAIWNKKKEWYQFESTDSVKGFVTTDEVAEWIYFTRVNIF
jgi:hypothetical protein